MAEYFVSPYEKETENKLQIVAHNVISAKEFIDRAGTNDFAEDFIKNVITAEQFMKRAVEVAKTINVDTVKLLREKAKLRGIVL